MSQSSKELPGSLLLILAVAGFLLLTSLFVVHEGQGAIVTRLGAIKAENGEGARTYVPGLYLKAPIFDRVHFFDIRLQTFEQKSSRILTKEQKYVLVDYYVKWRIEDLALYFKRTAGRTYKTEELIGQKVNDALRAAFGERSITDVVSGERQNIMRLLREEANTAATQLGVDVIDVRIKRIDLPSEVSQSVYERMRADRERVATKHRSDGQARAESVRATADAEATIIVATAQEKAASVRAEGEAKAAAIYNQAYAKNPQFYYLTKSLSAYARSFNRPDDLVVLRPDSKFFQFFKKTV